MAEELIRYELRDAVAVLHFDDGKANAISHVAIDALHGLLDRADKEAKAVLWVGRPGRFSGGFELSIMRSGGDAVRKLVTAGAELFLRMFDLPQPIVVACTGHAVAAGALVLLSSDARIGAQGDFKIGLSEVALGMTLPIFAVELARQRLSPLHFQRATTQGELYAPDAAVEAGYLDRVVPTETLLDTALEEAARLGALPQPAFSATKTSVRAAAIALIRETLDADMRKMTRGPSA